MNWYFWLFSLYALLITPVTVHVSLRIGHGVRYRLRIQAAGLPFIRRSEADESEGEKKMDSQQMAKGIFALDGRLLFSLFREGYFKRVFKAFRLQSAWVHVRISFADAAQTALCYAALRAALQTVLGCLKGPGAVRGRAEMDFDAEGSEIFARCILSARLGNLTAAMVSLGAAMIRLRAAAITEEGTYAEASH